MISRLAILMAVSATNGLLFAQEPKATADRLVQPLPRIAPEIYRYTDTCHTYVLRDGDAALLINLGDGEVVEHLANAQIKKIEWLLLTDHHRENCQGIGKIDRKITKLAASEIEAEILTKPTSFRKWFPKLGDKYSVYGASYARPLRQPIPIDRKLKPNDVFQWRGYELQCLLTPGHSPGNLCYVIRKNGKAIAFTGGLMHDGSKMTNWYDSEWDYGFGKGIDAMIASVDQLIEHEIDIALPSQGPTIRNADGQFKEYRKKLLRFRKDYIRGYPVFDKDIAKRDPVSKPTKIPHVNQVTPHLYKLSHLHPGKNFAVIVADSGRALVLDCGLFPKKIMEEIIVGMRANMGMKQIDAFWISHMHGDHFLLGPHLKEKYGAKAWTLDSIVDRCENPRRYDYSALVSAYGDGFDGMKIDKGFRDGESIEWEGYKIQVDWMPGQTEFGCCLWLEIDGKRIAFTGDNLFGSPSDESQNGHEAVVCRNSAILQEGYILGSKYLLDLNPDIVMGSHSYVMPEPRKFLERYHAWSKRMLNLYQDILPDPNYEYQFDPYWVSAYPYRVDLQETNSQDVTITVRNFRSRTQKHHVELKLPAGLTAEPATLVGEVPAKSRRRYKVKLTVNPTKAPHGLQIVPFDITLDGRRYGERFDFLVRLPED